MGGTVQALSAKLDVGGDLTLTSVQETSVTRGSQQGGGFSVSGSGGSVNMNASNTNGVSSWTVPSSIETIGALNINVGTATTVTGAMMNSATGALSLSTVSLIVTDLKDTNKLNTTGGGFSFGTNTDAKTGKTSNSGSVNVNLENKDKQGETKGTIGAGKVTVRSLSATEQAALLDTINRDPAKFTQVLIDNWDALRADIDLTNIAALPDTLKNFGEALKRIDDFLNKSYPNFTEKQKRSFEKALIGGVDSTMIHEQCLGRGYNRFNPINWIITPAFADGGECTIRVPATGLEFKIDKGDAKDCAEALETFKKQNPNGYIVPTDVAAAALVAIPVIALTAYASLVVVQHNQQSNSPIHAPGYPNNYFEPKSDQELPKPPPNNNPDGWLAIWGTIIGVSAGVLRDFLKGDFNIKFDDTDRPANRTYNNKTASQLNNEIEKGQAPSGIDRVDTPKTYGETMQVHFSNGNALNVNGTWKHSKTDDPTFHLTTSQKNWLVTNGFKLPK